MSITDVSGMIHTLVHASCLVVVEQQAAKESVGAAEGGLDLLAAAGDVAVAEHCDGDAVVLPSHRLGCLHTGTGRDRDGVRLSLP